MIPSGPVFYIIQYLVSGGYPLSLANAILNLFLPFYLFVTVRYLRLRVVASEAPIAARLSGGMQDYEREFGRMTHQSRSSC